MSSQPPNTAVRVVGTVLYCGCLWVLLTPDNRRKPSPAFWLYSARLLQRAAHHIGTAGLIAESRYWRSVA